MIFRKFTLLFLYLTGCGILTGSPDSSSQFISVLAAPDRSVVSMLAEGEAYKEGEKYQEAIQVYRQALQAALKEGNGSMLAKIKFEIGYCYNRLTKYEDALTYFTEVEQMDHDVVDAETLISVYTYHSSIHQALGNYEKAFELQLNALQLNEERNDQSGIARSNYLIGTIFFYQGQYEKALTYYKKSKEIGESLDEKKSTYACLAAIGSAYSRLNNQNQSLIYTQQALELARELDYKAGIAYAMGNLASEYLRKDQPGLAAEYFRQSIEIKKELNDNWGLIGGYLGLATLHNKEKKYDEAIDLLHRGLEISIQISAKPRQLEIYNELIITHLAKRDTGQAFAYQRRYLALKDSVLNEKTVEEMGHTQEKYEVQKKQHEIEMLTKENILLAQNKKIQKLRFFVLAAFGLVLFLFSVGFFSRLKLQRKNNQLLEEKNSLLFNMNEEINVKNKQLEQSNEDLAQFAYVASHDLKEPLRMISSYTAILQRKYHDKIDENGQEFMHYVVDAAKRMGVLLDDLLNYSRAGNQQPPRKAVQISNTVQIVEANLRHRLEEINGRITFTDDLPAVMIHQTMLIQLLQNLISNGLKFKSDRDPVVTVRAEKTTDHYLISISDNGIGIDENNLRKVFEMFRRLHTKQEYEGTGIGLATCKKIVNSWGGDIWAESVYGEGSTFKFTIPLTLITGETASAKVNMPAALESTPS